MSLPFLLICHARATVFPKHCILHAACRIPGRPFVGGPCVQVRCADRMRVYAGRSVKNGGG